MPTAANTQDLVEVQEIRDGVLVLKSGALCQIILVGGINFALKSESEQQSIIEVYQNFLNGLDFSIQIVVHSRRINIEKYLSSLDARKTAEISGLLRNQISEYQEFIRGFVSKFAVMRKLFLVVVPYYPTSLSAAQGLSKLLPFLSGAPTPTKEHSDEDTFRESAEQLQQRVEQVVSGLAPIGLETKVLTTEELTELLYNYYNPETIEHAGTVPSRT